MIFPCRYRLCCGMIRLVLPEGKPWETVLSGVYHDHWQKMPSGWHITHRTLRHDHQKPYLSQ
jgi:hypothetical protein